MLFGLAVALATEGAWAQRAPRPRLPRALAAHESGVVVRGGPRRTAPTAQGRSGSLVTRREMDERIVRSTPDALRDTVGVSVQQTAHGQASPYVRGVTGQQVLLLFDGVRLNNGLYRQGPNQYFFTVDSNTVDRIEVERGSASVRYGSDAIGGVVLAHPIEPHFDPRVRGFAVRPRAFGSYNSADVSPGGRAELEAQWGSQIAAVAGVGYRTASLLRGGAGGVRSLTEGSLARTPMLLEDRATQLGTGFRELTFDGRLVWRPRSKLSLVLAVYGYRQYDAPRTDLCAPTWASSEACVKYEEQFRTLAYASLRGEITGVLHELSATVSYQRAHERRRFDNPTGFSGSGWIDSVDTLGINTRAATPRMALTRRGSAGLTVRYGFDLWRDEVRSFEWAVYNHTGRVVDASRGQYLDGSNYLYGGAFSELTVDAMRVIEVRAGVRAALAHASAPSDPSSATPAISRAWGAFVARAGLTAKPSAHWAIVANIDQGFRPPNLDDLTSRQITGPGFQLENPALNPERSTTYELGTRARYRAIDLDAWGFVTRIDGAMIRAPRSLSDCPIAQSVCSASSTRLQLVNVQDAAWIVGAEASLRARIADKLQINATVSFAWGDAPSPLTIGAPRLPLSRVPPLHGSLDARYAVSAESFVGATLRWAADQTRLAFQDLSDPRIPAGGTPGYATLDLRAGLRFSRQLRVTAVLENLFDTAYRVHGSSINGPGRGVMLQAAVGW
ncbi:MAG: TonB-dependent receptor [Deltaproteobacteria bacterium]|nr:TonB-dependent receptor [Deltaproteobacteria bacterium]